MPGAFKTVMPLSFVNPDLGLTWASTFSDNIQPKPVLKAFLSISAKVPFSAHLMSYPVLLFVPLKS